MHHEQTVSEIQEADTNNPSAAVAADAFALTNADITLSRPNKVPRVINWQTAVSDDEDDE